MYTFGTKGVCANIGGWVLVLADCGRRKQALLTERESQVAQGD